MPLPYPRTAPVTTIRSFGNAYLDASANTVEFGARIYNTPEAARERALSHSIREGLTYLGPIEITTQVSEDFITTGAQADASRLERVRMEREANESAEREAERYAERESCAGSDIGQGCGGFQGGGLPADPPVDVRSEERPGLL